MKEVEALTANAAALVGNPAQRLLRKRYGWMRRGSDWRAPCRCGKRAAQPARRR